jgi:hypothetical protein
MDETANHISICQEAQSRNACTMTLYEALEALHQINTNAHILGVLETNLTHTLKIENRNKYLITDPEPKIISNACQHQNIIGWDLLLRGYASKYWSSAQKDMVDDRTPPTKTKWNHTFVKHMIDLHRNIWTDRNTFVKGKDKKEAMEKARHSIIQRVQSLYQKPPKLAQRYPSVTSISLEDRLRKPTKYLSGWLHRIDHQIRMTDHINKTRPPGQLTIQQAFAKARRQRISTHSY